MEFQDYYKILGVPRTATQAEIKKAFRKLARESHPDRHAGDKAAEQRFKAVNEANAVLSDPAKRAKYDQFGQDWEAYARAGAGGAGGGGGANPFGPGGPFAGWSPYRSAGGSAGRGTGSGGVRYEFRTSGDPGAFSDFFRMMFGDESEAAGEPERFGAGGGGLDEVLSRMYGGTTRAGSSGAAASGDRAGRGGPARLAPIDVTAEIGLEEAFHGTSRIVDIDGRRLEVAIPRGVDTGNRIRLTGKGPDGRDLVVVVRVKAHPTFERRGADLEREVPVTLREALLGAEVPVQTLKGRVLLTLPAGTQTGRTFRLKGQGLPRFKGDGTGDLYVRVRAVLPTELSDEAKRAAKRFLDVVDQPDPRTRSQT